MPINNREWEQIKVAIQAMQSVNLVGYGLMISQNDVFAIISRWREDTENSKITSPSSIDLLKEYREKAVSYRNAAKAGNLTYDEGFWQTKIDRIDAAIGKESE